MFFTSLRILFRTLSIPSLVTSSDNLNLITMKLLSGSFLIIFWGFLSQFSSDSSTVLHDQRFPSGFSLFYLYFRLSLFYLHYEKRNRIGIDDIFKSRRVYPLGFCGSPSWAALKKPSSVTTMTDMRNQ